MGYEKRIVCGGENYFYLKKKYLLLNGCYNNFFYHYR
jgi:hypothetical protein